MSTLRQMPTAFAGTDIFLMYGLTEGFRATYLDPALFETKMGAMGRPIPGTEVFVVDPEKALCGPGERGELVQSGSLTVAWKGTGDADALIHRCRTGLPSHMVPKSVREWGERLPRTSSGKFDRARIAAESARDDGGDPPGASLLAGRPSPGRLPFGRAGHHREGSFRNTNCSTGAPKTWKAIETRWRAAFARCLNLREMPDVRSVSRMGKTFAANAVASAL